MTHSPRMHSLLDKAATSGTLVAGNGKDLLFYLMSPDDHDCYQTAARALGTPLATKPVARPGKTTIFVASAEAMKPFLDALEDA